MQALTRLAKWGGSMAVRIPKNVLEAAGFTHGDKLVVSTGEDGALRLEPYSERQTLAELTAGWDGEYTAEPVDFGFAGKEVGV